MQDTLLSSQFSANSDFSYSRLPAHLIFLLCDRSNGLSFEDFVKLLRSGSVDGISSSTAALDIYDPRVSSVHRGHLAEEAGLVNAQHSRLMPEL